MMCFDILVEERAVNLPKFLVVSIGLGQFICTSDEQVEKLLVCLSLLSPREAEMSGWEWLLLDQSIVMQSDAETSGSLIVAFPL